MAQVFKALAVIIFISVVSACVVSQGKDESLAKADQSDKKREIHVSFNFDAANDQGNSISGFRLYKEGKLICETNAPKSKSIDCNFSSPGGSFLFTMTTYFEDGSESAHSAPFSYTIPD